MINILKFLGFGNAKQKFSEILQKDYLIIDVRSEAEYSAGHIPNSLNIPLPDLSANIKYLKSLQKPIITCCASGIRSAMAKSVLQKDGVESINGGSWQSLQKKIGR
jgi:phage shock protein E